jgi:hypothetical protein
MPAYRPVPSVDLFTPAEHFVLYDLGGRRPGLLLAGRDIEGTVVLWAPARWDVWACSSDFLVPPPILPYFAATLRHLQPRAVTGRADVQGTGSGWIHAGGLGGRAAACGDAERHESKTGRRHPASAPRPDGGGPTPRLIQHRSLHQSAFLTGQVERGADQNAVHAYTKRVLLSPALRPAPSKLTLPPLNVL